MLKMNRRLNETIVIGDEIEVTLVQIQFAQDQVRLGISAPKQIGVYRKEVLLAIKRENKRAATQGLEGLPDDLVGLTRPQPEDEV